MLDRLHKCIERYVEGFYLYHDKLRTRSLQFRIPIIILSALTAAVSFVNTTELSKYFSIAAGSMTLCVTILASIEGYLKLPQHTNATENVLKTLGKLSRKVFVLQHSPGPVDPKLILEIAEELGKAMDDAPIIPAHTYKQLKPMINERIIYSTFDEVV